MKVNSYRVFAIILILLYFLLGFFTYGKAGLTGLDLSAGKTSVSLLGADKAYSLFKGQPLLFLMLILPVLLLAVSFIPNVKRFSNIAGIVSSAACIVTLLFAYSKFNKVAYVISDGGNYTLGLMSAGAGYYLFFFVNIVILIIAVYKMIAAKSILIPNAAA